MTLICVYWGKRSSSTSSLILQKEIKPKCLLENSHGPGDNRSLIMALNSGLQIAEDLSIDVRHHKLLEIIKAQ